MQRGIGFRLKQLQYSYETQLCFVLYIDKGEDALATLAHIIKEISITMKTRLILACCVAMCTIKTALCAYPELLWDMEHINEMSGEAKLTLHHPDFHEVVMVHDAPWEGNVCCYHTVLYDGVKYRMYYRGAAYKLPGYSNHQVTCYAESDDGIHWVKPNLGLYEFNGSKENNIILMNDGDVAHNFSPCFDTNPASPPEQRYKALGGQSKGVFLYSSPDGIHWSRAQEEPVLTQGAFDSQNTIFYDSVNNRYVANSRCFYPVKEGFSARGIQRNTSEDAIHWSKPERLDYGTDAPNIELYTNGIHPYVNNPSVYIGLPKRFNRTRCSIYDKSDAGGLPGVSDGGFMSSRDALHYHRWDEAFIRPGIQHERWVNRNNMCALGVVLTKADLEGTPPVLTIYSTEGYYGPTPNRLRRLTIRQDGFVSIHAPLTGGAFTMKPLEVVVSGYDMSGENAFRLFNQLNPKQAPICIGSENWGEVMLLLNASTSALGEIRCEIRDEQNNPIPGYSLEDSLSIFGDELNLAVFWKNGPELKSLLGRKVILHFELKDADIYSFRFGKPSADPDSKLQ